MLFLIRARCWCIKDRKVLRLLLQQPQYNLWLAKYKMMRQEKIDLVGKRLVFHPFSSQLGRPRTTVLLWTIDLQKKLQPCLLYNIQKLSNPFSYTMETFLIFLFNCHIPYPCSHFYFDIIFGNRLYSKEKRKAWSLLF